MAKKKSKMKISSYTYELNGEIHTATATKPDAQKKRAITSKLAATNDADDNCNCGETKCVDGKKWKCMPLDDEGTCIWFVTSENC